MTDEEFDTFITVGIFYNMSELHPLHTMTVPYPTLESKREMTCISVNSLEDLEPLDFREFVPPDEAQQDFELFTASVIRGVLDKREESFGEAQPITDIEKITSFLGKLAIKPFGKLSYVDELIFDDERVSVPGITTSLHRQAFVIGNNLLHDHDLGGSRTNSLVPKLTNDVLTQFIAVHELVHLSGIPDVVYYVADTTVRHKINNIRFSRPSLNAQNSEAANFFEEGFATLIAHMFLWKEHPEVFADLRTAPKRSPTGVELSLPARHTFSQNAYAFSAWALERLIDFSPAIWKVLHDSRLYTSQPSDARNALKKQIDELHPALFDLIDTTHPHDLDQVMHAAHVVDGVVRRVLGR